MGARLCHELLEIAATLQPSRLHTPQQSLNDTLKILYYINCLNISALSLKRMAKSPKYTEKKERPSSKNGMVTLQFPLVKGF